MQQQSAHSSLTCALPCKQSQPNSLSQLDEEASRNSQLGDIFCFQLSLFFPCIYFRIICCIRHINTEYHDLSFVSLSSSIKFCYSAITFQVPKWYKSSTDVPTLPQRWSERAATEKPVLRPVGVAHLQPILLDELSLISRQ